MAERAAQEDFFVQDDEDTQKGKYLIFSLGKEQYGLEIKYVMEIIGIQPITEVPEHPHIFAALLT